MLATANAVEPSQVSPRSWRIANVESHPAICDEYVTYHEECALTILSNRGEVARVDVTEDGHVIDGDDDAAEWAEDNQDAVTTALVLGPAKHHCEACGELTRAMYDDEDDLADGGWRCSKCSVEG